MVTTRTLSHMPDAMESIICKHPRLFEANILLFPLNRGNVHWVLGAVVNPFNVHSRASTPTIIMVIDSMDASAAANSAHQCAAPELDYLIRFLHAINSSKEAKACRKQCNLSTSLPRVQLEEFRQLVHMPHVHVPQQHNGFDCGVFTLAFIDSIVANSTSFRELATRLAQPAVQPDSGAKFAWPEQVSIAQRRFEYLAQFSSDCAHYLSLAFQEHDGTFSWG